MIKVNTREMRILLMYDIYYINEDDNKLYNKFIKELYKLGYVRLQYSIYSKIIPTHLQYNSEKKKLLRIIPKNSNIRIAMLTEKQYQNIEILNGTKSKNEIYNLEEDYIKL
ncbi:CRISPR-associated endonuclease Cas2 [Mesomycoplasma ovipneumoniae]|uniref:CRISPR-associated endoribonuclease Cas2 n=3 Tax=Mesomycoplasma ovipneumoniae TaxID=29562 RepID=A0AAJ2P6Z9_9BACT|nr:CRISPR-associated endonuclease Cas2 [Mesomycoplasma ovipneumoniae]MCP9306804.1 CRISPR-associated endonuclease Cas2 [Mesomycoplasma ovipneumoniae]MDO6857345.1 CRISPR-associated endonuclease Cas2 [Mesomycoplasma ovipneumoniae]MDW2829838.1 CRISPR-associated endonuclease Cas2 [Mesomycoplasma ovipneumoniae]MDW2871180.1 CRISPR-associated endonuclease Cas2 [Mesomycoplasma ovipneumoniae]MDW2893702.1 CRISPR-associated endonuclease Cas2 [Mesomycoplasma ovipneumoniae]